MTIPLIPLLVGAAAGAAVTYWLRKPASEDGDNSLEPAQPTVAAATEKEVVKDDLTKPDQ